MATVSAKRKGDAVINIYQDNNAKKIIIENLNPAAEKLTGYNKSELSGKDFDHVLAARVKEALHSYIEFDDAINDFASVARKIPNFQIKQKNGREIPVSLKVFYLMSENKSRLEYELLMRDITLIQRIKELKEKLANTKAEDALDAETGLLSVSSIQDSLSVAYLFIQNAPIEVSFAAISIDNLTDYAEEHGEDEAFKLVKAVGKEVELTCRDEDLVGHIGAGDIGVVLLDCSAADAQKVLERVNKNVISKPIILENGEEAEAILSIAYFQLTTQHDLAHMYDTTLQKLLNIQESGGNKISQVTF